MPTEAPTAADLERNPVVHTAMEAAWIDSLARDASLRHEEGGWIYWNLTTREVTIGRGPPGIGTAIVLDDPPIVEGSLIVGAFHTSQSDV